MVTDLSSNGIYINGVQQRTTRGSRKVLADGDQLRIGAYVITVAEINDQAAGHRVSGEAPDRLPEHPSTRVSATRQLENPFDPDFSYDIANPDDADGEPRADHASPAPEQSVPPDWDELLDDLQCALSLPASQPMASVFGFPPPRIQGETDQLKDKPTDSGADDHRRVIDANLLADRFEPAAIVTLTVTIRLPSSELRGKWHDDVRLDPSRGPILILLETHGFTLVSECPPPIELPTDGDTAPVAFELRIEAPPDRWLHLFLMQAGRRVGELMINDFSALGQAPARHDASAPFRSLAEADLMLVIRSGDGRIEASSPRERASLDHVTLAGFRYPERPFRELLTGRLRALYDDRSDPDETARELRLVGVELARCLPTDLVKLLRRSDVRSVMLRHEDDFDFPLELCFLDDTHDPFFVGDRIAICRWYLGVTNLPDLITKRVRKVAFVKGTDEAFRADEELLRRLYPDCMATFGGRVEVREKLFKTADFDLIHFTGHCRQSDKAAGGLELADGSYVRLIEIGQLESERAFAAAQPFVMLNACASAKPYLGLTERGSFAHRFVTSSACAVVGTLWPVSGYVANEFAERFYAELASKPIGAALVSAKLALIATNSPSGLAEGKEEGRRRALARQVAVRSYCLFANPDLRLFS